MDKQTAIQDILFEKIKEKIEPNYSLVHEVSELLELSYDSTYRRLRGEKIITLNEAIVLCRHFNLSLDEIYGNNHNLITFRHMPVKTGEFSGERWLDNILFNIDMIYNEPKKNIIYSAKDPPIFQYFQFPEIAAFKFFFWEKTLFGSPCLENVKFDLNNINPKMAKKCLQISRLATKIPTTEIWNEDTFRIFMRQIAYYWVSGYFNSIEDLNILLEKMELWLLHNQKEAELGMRFLHGEEPRGIENSYILYENEVVLNDNTISINLKDKKMAFITYNVLGLLGSSEPGFCESIENLQKSIMSKSNLISQVGEKERNRFFNKLHRFIHDFKAAHGI